MEAIFRAVAEHPAIVMAVCFAVLVLLYFLLKSLIKLLLLFIIVAVAIGGYFYFQYPESRPTSFKDAVQKARTLAVKAIERGKAAGEKGRELIEKGSETCKKDTGWADKGRTLLREGIDKGKDAIKKVKRWLDKGRRFVEELKGAFSKEKYDAASAH